MGQAATLNLLLTVQSLVCLFIAMRALYLYRKTRSDDLLILGLSMFFITLAGINGLIGNNLYHGKFNITLFQHGGQSFCFLFILLSTFRGSDRYIGLLKRWFFACLGLTFVVLALTPILPPTITPLGETILSNIRTVLCFILFYRYLSFFFRKETRFSLLMAVVFCLLAIGIAMSTWQFFPHSLVIYLYVGYAFRIASFTIMLGAFFL